MTDNITEEQARQALDIKPDEWIITVTDDELQVLQIIMQGRMSALERLNKKISEIG